MFSTWNRPRDHRRRRLGASALRPMLLGGLLAATRTWDISPQANSLAKTMVHTVCATKEMITPSNPPPHGISHWSCTSTQKTTVVYALWVWTHIELK